MKKVKLFLLGVFGIILLTGCDLFKVDTMEDINIITTSYPLEFVLKELYGEHSLVKSIFPDGTDISTYELNDKLLDNYSKEDLFVYVSFGNDKDIAVELLERNKKLLLIDGSLGMSPDYIEELWLNPSNLLMVAQNIKNGLTEYISNNYLIKEIESNYEELKLKLSELDAEIKITAENATSKTIVTGTKSLNYLKKYGFNVISLDDDNNSIDKTVKEVTEMINVSSIKYVYTLENEELNETVRLLLENNASLKEIKLKKIDNITDDERNNGDDYFKLMNYNLEQIKKETYK
ncbi:MAG: zinc ABC transporter substrate-binding protein [Bacilli bacterium]|nr:zinc ABC transporter substrate-binding protein [Bacilli bacterium]